MSNWFHADAIGRALGFSSAQKFGLAMAMDESERESLIDDDDIEENDEPIPDDVSAYWMQFLKDEERIDPTGKDYK